MKPSKLHDFQAGPDRLMKLNEVAEMMGGISVKTIRRYIEQGILPRAVRINRSLMLWASEVRACIEGMRVKQPGFHA